MYEGKGRRDITNLLWRGPMIGVLCPPRRPVVVVMVVVMVVVIVMIIIVRHQFHPILRLLGSKQTKPR